MCIEKDPEPEHEKEYSDVELLGTTKVGEFSGIRDKLSPKEHVDLFAGLEPDSGGKKLLVVTDKRLLTFTSGKTKLLGEKSEFNDIKLEDIEDININERKDFDLMKIETNDDIRKFMLPEGTGVQVAGHIRDMQGLTTAERIEELGELKDKGNISEEEFQEKKEELMNRI